MNLYGYVYKIENLVNNKVYIGQTIQKVNRRKIHHFSTLRGNYHYNTHLQKSFNKYGESNFKFNVLNWANTQKELDKLEIHYINKYDSTDWEKGYNLKEGGHNAKPSLENRRKTSLLFKGKKRPEEVGIKISKTLTGKYRGENSPNYGKKYDLKRRFNNGVAQKGRGLFGFSGVRFKRRHYFEGKCWESQISYNKNKKYLGLFSDPLTAELIYEFTFNEIFKED